MDYKSTLCPLEMFAKDLIENSACDSYILSRIVNDAKIVSKTNVFVPIPLLVSTIL